ncbi:MAG TPA: penicillin-binding protein 2 [Luteimonas sp.]|nr:penicillin-binding protein 2 [Luteimonas sp.]
MARRRPIKNAGAEAAQFRARAAIGFVLVLLALGGLGAWYFRLQVVEHADYAMRSQANRIKPRPVIPGRGLILDRKGRVLADNVPAYRLDVTPEQAGDIPTLVARLSKIISLSPDDIEHFNADRKATRGFRAVTLKLRMSDEEAARFAVDRWRYPGVDLVPYLSRRYPYGPLFAHVIGYVGRIDDADLAKLGQTSTAFTHTGKSGLERYYEEALRGRIGYEQVETNVEGRALHTVGRVPATPGADLRLSIDLDLQQAAATAFGDFDGSAVAVDPRTGEILAMVSLPSFDPNLFVNGISHDDYRALMDNPSRPLFNRNVLGGGPPGSTIKPFLALAALDSGMRRPEDKVFSTGEFHIPGQRRGYRDAHGGAGWTDLRKSIAESVNYYYFKLAYDMGIARFDYWVRKFGFGEPTGIDLLGENPGIVPSPEWKAKHSKEPWYVGETVIAGIGQGYWKVTLLQLARGVAALADNGWRNRLHLVRERRDGYNAPWVALPQPAPVRISDNADHLRVVAEGMMQTMQPGGTGAEVARGAPYVIAGKTGTAQNTSRKGNISVNPHALPLSLRHQAWFIAYAPVDNPRIAVAVMVEHGGFGASTAGPIARKIMDAYLLGKMPEPERNPEVVAHAGALPATPTAAVAVPASPVSTGPLPANPAPAAP